VGAARPEKADVRIVSATNREPLAEVEAGRFREDLYYRLYVVPIELPPLRDRGDDVLMIARHFLGQFSKEEGKRFRGFSREAEAAIVGYPWPGNVRQLQNAMRNVVVLHDSDVVEAAMLPAMLLRASRPVGSAPPAVELSPPAHYEPLAAPLAIPLAVAPPPIPAPTLPPPPVVEPLAVMEKRLILAALEQTGQDVPRAAALLEVNPSTIYRKLAAWRAAS
jgi:two-component system repressor protein LuxO